MLEASGDNNRNLKLLWGSETSKMENLAALGDFLKALQPAGSVSGV